MRYRLKLQVDHDFGSILPLNYQLEVSRLMYEIITDDGYKFKQWLKDNELPIRNSSPFFNFSNIIVLDRKIYGDRMLILSDTIELTLSFLYDNFTDELVYYAFDNLVIRLGDEVSKLRLKVVGIEKLPYPKFYDSMQFVARSPIVLKHYENTKYVRFLAPNEPGYNDLFTKNLIDKYESYTGEKMDDQNIFTSIEPITEPKSKLLGINGRQKELIKGYLFRFSANAPRKLLEVGYKIGFGDKNSLGFGFCDVLFSTEKKLTPTLSKQENSEVSSVVEPETEVEHPEEV